MGMLLLKGPNTKVIEVCGLKICERINNIRMIWIFKRNPTEPVLKAVGCLLQMLQLLGLPIQVTVNMAISHNAC